MFQLVDDLLDFTGEAEALGKPIGGDLLEGKMTLPLIHLRDHGGPEAVALIRRIVAERHCPADDWARLRQLMAEHRSLDYAQTRAHAFADAAKRNLAIFPDRPEREALLALTEFVATRDR
jgi:octaprenyl-diphosphate synthase